MLDNKGRSREMWPLLATISGFSEGVAPEGTPQRLCPHSPVLSRTTAGQRRNRSMLASPVQYGGTDQLKATQRSDADRYGHASQDLRRDLMRFSHDERSNDSHHRC